MWRRVSCSLGNERNERRLDMDYYNYYYLGFAALMITAASASVLPILLIHDEQSRIRWNKILFWLCVASVVLNGIWQVLCMELNNGDGSAILFWCIVICSLVLLWISVRWGLASVKNIFLRIFLVLLRGVVISLVISACVIFGSFTLVLLVTGRGGA